MAIVPGYFDGVSSSRMGGFNVGINNKIKEEKIDAAIEFLKYATSEETQKELFISGESVPAMLSLYDDEEVCKVKDCEMFKKLQHMKKPKESNSDIIPDYGKKFYKISQNYLYNDTATIDQLISSLVDISKIYNISLDSTIGLISIIVISVISLIMLLSLIFLFIDNYMPFFKFLPSDMWTIIIIGIILTLCSILTKIGKLTNFRCNLKILLLNFGYVLTIIPLLYKFIRNFPEENKYSKWIKKNRYSFLFIFILVDAFLYSFSLIKPYFKSEDLYFDVFALYDDKADKETKNYQKCTLNNGFPLIMFSFIIISKILLLLISLVLIFIEWNIEKTYFEIRFVVNSIYSTILLIVALMLVEHLDIKNRQLHFIVHEIIIGIISISNYFILYGFKLILAFMNRTNVKLDFIKKINDHFIDNDFVSSQVNTEELSYVKTNNTIPVDNFENSIKQSSIEGIIINNNTNNKNTNITTRNNNGTSNNSNNNSSNNNNTSNSKSVTSKKTMETSFINKLINYHYTVKSNESNDNVAYEPDFSTSNQIGEISGF